MKITNIFFGEWNIFSFAQSQKLEIPFLFSLIILLGIMYSKNFISISEGYLPALTDEYRYFGDAKFVAENGFGGSAFLIFDQQSGIGGFGSHGFAYSWLNGIIYKISGHNILSMPISNLAYLFLSFVLILSKRKGFSIIQKLHFSALLFSFFAVIIFAFSYMQESIQVLFSVIIGISLLDVYAKKNIERKKVLLFIIYVLIASTFRINWIFWLIALLPIYKKKKQILWFLAGYVIVILLTFLIFKIIYATYVLGFIYQLIESLKTENFSSTFILFFEHAFNNLKYYFRFFYYEKHFPYYYYGKLLIIAFGVFSLISGIRNKNSISLAFGLVILVNLAALILLYDSYDWREIRSLSPLIYVGFLLLTSKNKTKIVYQLLVLQIIMLPQVFVYLNLYIKEHKDVFVVYNKSKPLVNSFSKLVDFLDKSKPITVLLSSDFTKNHSVLTIGLPYKNKNNFPIRYSMHFSNEIISEPGFADYILTVNKISISNQKTELVERNAFFVVYKISRKFSNK